ncbi:hypothetical protein [Spiroplasma ixodetis]|nr:hypothetical protein [Spiroplasma ixodetis]
MFKIYSKFEEKQMYHVFLNKFEYFSNLRRIRCLKCHQTFSILHGTIF